MVYVSVYMITKKSDCSFSKKKKGAFLDIVAKCEISRVLLLMLLEVSINIFFSLYRTFFKTRIVNHPCKL